MFPEYTFILMLIHLALAIFLFFIVNWIGRRAVSIGYMQMSVIARQDNAPAFNFLFRILSPVVYLVICAVFFQYFDINIKYCYFIVVYYWIIRILFICITNRSTLTNWKTQFLYWISSIGLAIWIYGLLENVEEILPTPRALLDQLWILIILFIYSVLNKLEISNVGTIKRKNNYLTSRYIKFKKKYGDDIIAFFHNNIYEAITYSIMIYEDFNRPFIIRCMEYLFFYLRKGIYSLGIMQYQTNKYITNKDSLLLAMKKIARDGKTIIEEKDRYHISDDYPRGFASLIANKYNSGDDTYGYEVSEVFDYIYTKFYSNTNDKKCVVIDFDE